MTTPEPRQSPPARPLTPPPWREHRQHQRLKPEDLRGRVHFHSRLKVVDLSLTGMAVESAERLVLHRAYRIRLHLGGHTVALVGRPVWCHLVSTRRLADEEVIPIFRAGLSFAHRLPAATGQLAALIEDNALGVTEKRICGRFTFSPAATVDLERSFDFNVYDLSQGGMGIHTDLLPAPDTYFEMELGLPGQPLAITGQVRSIRATGANRRDRKAEVGVRFSSLPKLDSLRLESFLAGLARRQGVDLERPAVE